MPKRNVYLTDYTHYLRAVQEYIEQFYSCEIVSEKATATLFDGAVNEGDMIEYVKIYDNIYDDNEVLPNLCLLVETKVMFGPNENNDICLHFITDFTDIKTEEHLFKHVLRSLPVNKNEDDKTGVHEDLNSEIVSTIEEYINCWERLNAENNTLLRLPTQEVINKALWHQTRKESGIIEELTDVNGNLMDGFLVYAELAPEEDLELTQVVEDLMTSLKYFSTIYGKDKLFGIIKVITKNEIRLKIHLTNTTGFKGYTNNNDWIVFETITHVENYQDNNQEMNSRLLVEKVIFFICSAYRHLEMLSTFSPVEIKRDKEDNVIEVKPTTFDVISCLLKKGVITMTAPYSKLVIDHSTSSLKLFSPLLYLYHTVNSHTDTTITNECLTLWENHSQRNEGDKKPALSYNSYSSSLELEFDASNDLQHHLTVLNFRKLDNLVRLLHFMSWYTHRLYRKVVVIGKTPFFVPIIDNNRKLLKFPIISHGNNDVNPIIRSLFSAKLITESKEVIVSTKYDLYYSTDHEVVLYYIDSTDHIKLATIRQDLDNLTYTLLISHKLDEKYTFSDVRELVDALVVICLVFNKNLTGNLIFEDGIMKIVEHLVTFKKEESDGIFNFNHPLLDD